MRHPQVSPVLIDKSKIWCIIWMLHKFFRVLLTCSYNSSFLAKILVIMDDGVESNPGLNINDFRIKEHDTSRVKGRPKKNLHL